MDITPHPLPPREGANDPCSIPLTPFPSPAKRERPSRLLREGEG